jgi:hypothetical protein
MRQHHEEDYGGELELNDEFESKRSSVLAPLKPHLSFYE